MTAQEFYEKNFKDFDDVELWEVKNDIIYLMQSYAEDYHKEKLREELIRYELERQKEINSEKDYLFRLTNQDIEMKVVQLIDEYLNQKGE